MTTKSVTSFFCSKRPVEDWGRTMRIGVRVQKREEEPQDNRGREIVLPVPLSAHAPAVHRRSIVPKLSLLWSISLHPHRANCGPVSGDSPLKFQVVCP